MNLPVRLLLRFEVGNFPADKEQVSYVIELGKEAFEEDLSAGPESVIKKHVKAEAMDYPDEIWANLLAWWHIRNFHARMEGKDPTEIQLPDTEAVGLDLDIGPPVALIGTAISIHRVPGNFPQA